MSGQRTAFFKSAGGFFWIWAKKEPVPYLVRTGSKPNFFRKNHQNRLKYDKICAIMYYVKL